MFTGTMQSTHTPPLLGGRLSNCWKDARASLRAVIPALVVLVLVPHAAFGSPHVLHNEGLEITLDIIEGRTGAIRLTGIRDLVANHQWLTEPSPLFEVSADDLVWSSDNSLNKDPDIFLILDSVQQIGAAQLIVYARTSKLRLNLELQITMPSGSGPALVGGSIRNEGKDWFGPFLIGDHGARPVPVFPTNAGLAVVRRSVKREEVLVSGFDGILYATEERDDGPWSIPKPLQLASAARIFFPPGAPLAGVRRNDHQHDVFAIANDCNLYTVFRLEDHWWSKPMPLSNPPPNMPQDCPGPFLQGGSVAALSVHEQTDPPPDGGPRQNEVAVLAISRLTGQVLVSRETNDGKFSEPAPINPSHPALNVSAHLAVVKRNEDQQDLFVVDPLGSLLTAFHHQQAPRWSEFIPLSTPGPRLRPGSRLAAVRGRGDDVHVFVVGQAANGNSTFGCIYETHETNDGAWSPLRAITPPVPGLTPGSSISAVRRSGAEIDVFVVHQDGTIGVITRAVDDSWSNFSFLTTALPVDPTANLTAILRRPGQMDLFGIDRTSGRLWTATDGLSTVYLRTVFPKIRFTGTSTLTGSVGMVPQEMGVLTILKDPDKDPEDPEHPGDVWNTLGMPYKRDLIAQIVGLPEAMNSLEVVNVARQGRSLFFADMGGSVEAGRAPIQFTLAPDEVDGFWVSYLKGHHQIALPQFAIGVGDGDFRRAIDFYVSNHSSNLASPDTPAWLREAGAIYTFAGGGAGGIYLDLKDLPHGTSLKDYSDQTICPNDVSKFRCVLRRMWGEAQALGTNVLYLYDYWEAVSPPTHSILTCPDVIRQPKPPHYFCKGDYFIREDLGGMTELRAAIDEIRDYKDSQDRRGRVILYVEPFLIHQNSAIGNAFGDLWGSRFPGASEVWNPFGDRGIAMSQANGEWQQRLVATARSLVDSTHADGIFLDSAGWRLNLRAETKQEVVLNSPLENAMAVLNLVDRVRTAIRTVEDHQEAVVLSENTSGPMWRHVDGGVSADFNKSTPAFTGDLTLNGALLTSPTRYGAPLINIFSNGRTLNQLNQVFANGHGLALSTNWGTNFMADNASYIQQLVRARRLFASALVHGAQVEQLDIFGAQGGFVVAYSYRGSPDIVTILNPNSTAFNGTVPVHALMQAGTKWRDYITGEVFTVTPSGVTMTVPPVPPVIDRCRPLDRMGPATCGLRVLENISGK